jgi:hypothetical protein
MCRHRPERKLLLNYPQRYRQLMSQTVVIVRAILPEHRTPKPLLLMYSALISTERGFS